MVSHHWFIPHKDTHKKARLLSWEAILIYILLFILLQVGFSIVSYSQPGILGISGNIDQKKLIELTNKKREQAGLLPLRENEALDKAALLKAQNMFSENYWAHFAPSGKTPWDFILGSGYKFTYAGENLAKNFYQSEGVVEAWLASPTHRDNLLNSKYQDIGIAAVDGVLNGQKTTLIVQMFGTATTLGSGPQVNISGKNISIPKEKFTNQQIELVAAAQKEILTNSLIDPYQVTKFTGFGLVILLGTLLVVDFWVLKKRGVFRLSSNHFAHMSILSIAAASLLTSNPGSIL